MTNFFMRFSNQTSIHDFFSDVRVLF